MSTVKQRRSRVGLERGILNTVRLYSHSLHSLFQIAFPFEPIAGLQQLEGHRWPRAFLTAFANCFQVCAASN